MTGKDRYPPSVPGWDDHLSREPDSLGPTSTRDSDQRARRQIGPYRLFEKIGEGGFGEVYAADQTTPVKRRVALKLLKAGMDSESVLARFEAERQALAMMSHPNIARVLDFGETEGGRSYFVMDLIQGEPITAYCDRHRLSTRDRLDLFLPVCAAIQHAHQKGVIHRDVKPGNVLVALVDGKPVPKVIDFGIAKAISATSVLSDRSLHTLQGQMIGTPAYMSPEQAEMTGLNVDTTTDVYSLGVLLYELLTGVLPFDAKALFDSGFEEMCRIIREVDPPRPSTRINHLGGKGTTVAARRNTEPAILERVVRGELDWIVQKAMAKDRTRRYETVSALAGDVRSYLSDEPVLAGPPSASYRARKFAKRHRVGVAFAATVFLALGLGLFESNRQRAQITAAKDDLALVTASLQEMLASVAPWLRGRDVTVREMLDETAKTLGVKFKDKPLVEASLRYTVGKAYRELGKFDAAAMHLERALELRRIRPGMEAPETLVTMSTLAELYLIQGRYEEAESIQGEALAIQRRVLGEEHRQTLMSMLRLAAAYTNQGRYDEGETLFRENLAIQRRVLGDEHEQTLMSMHNLASVYEFQGRNEEAQTLFRRTLEIERRVQGDEHPNTLSTMASVGRGFRREGRYDEAEALQTEGLEIARRIVGEEGEETLKLMANLAATYWDQGRHEEAEALKRQTLEIQRRVLGEAHPDTALSRYDLACIMALQGRRGEAIQFLRVAAEHGYIDANQWGARDSDLASLRGDPEFEALIARLEERTENR